MTIQAVGLPPEMAARLQADRDLLHGLRASIARRIRRDLDILDALTPDADLEDNCDSEPSADHETTAAEWTGRGAQRFTDGACA